jgi:Flp pilus assembly protein TadG
MMFNKFHNLAADNRGAAIIELAIIAPVFALMTVGVVDMSNAFSRKLALEQGAQRAIEKIMQTTATDTVENTLKTEAVCQVDGVNSDGTCKSSPITTSNVTVTLRQECISSSGTAAYEVVVNSTSDSDTFDAHQCATGTTSEARYIRVAVTDKYTPLFPLHFAAINGDGTYHLSATAGMRTK